MMRHGRPVVPANFIGYVCMVQLPKAAFKFQRFSMIKTP